MAITNRYEFMYFVECINGNPNGDPDAGNSPRMDPQDMHGLISDVAIKRRIRNYVQIAKQDDPRNQIIVQQSTNINKFIALAHEEVGSSFDKKTSGREEVNNAKDWLCRHYYDVRTFGAVLSTGKNAGQVRGPVQLTFLRSCDPILPLDMSITRVQVAEDAGKEYTFKDYEEWEEKQEENKLRTMGRKQLIPYGLYQGRGFVSANIAKDTEFGEVDLALLWEALLNMYEHDRSASKGHMSTIAPLIIFKHVGTDSDLVQRERQAKLGCAPAHELFGLVHIEKITENEPRSYEGYKLSVRLSKVPRGVQVGFAYLDGGKVEISWDKLPDRFGWVVVS